MSRGARTDEARPPIMQGHSCEAYPSPAACSTADLPATRLMMDRDARSVRLLRLRSHPLFMRLTRT